MNLYNYWDRLSIMKLYSVQRRHERYRIIYIWKILQGIVPNPGIKYDSNSFRGRQVTIPKSTHSHCSLVVRMRNQLLSVHRGKLFNILPANIRYITQSLEILKTELDGYLNNILDHPATSNLNPEPLDPLYGKNSKECKHSNSILHWVPKLKISERRPIITDIHDVML